MATSKPVYQSYVYQNGSLYCALYKREIINTSGSATVQWYWMPSNKSGDIIDYRANALNGFFSSESAATNPSTGIPSGYNTLTVDRWQSDKYMSYCSFYPFDNITSTKEAITDWVSIGSNNLVIQFEYADIFKSASAQSTNADSSYSKVDDIINYAKATGQKVTLIINLDVDDNYVNDFWGLSNNETDEWGNPIRIGYGFGYPSLADTNTGSGRSTITDYFQKVLARYAGSSFLGNQFLQVIPTITVHKEFGYNFTNQYYPLGANNPVPEYYALSGYSTATKTGFINWLQSSSNPDKYATKDALNAAWGTSFGSFSAVTPPTTGKGVGTATISDYTQMFSTNQGRDWYKYLVSLLYGFATDLKNIVTAVNISKGTNIKFVLGFGGNSPNDFRCLLRMSWDVIKWGTCSDGLKTAFGVDNRDNTTAITLDYVQNYPNKILTELNHIDFWGDERNPLPPDLVKINMTASGTAAITNGAREIMFISAKKNGDYYNMMKDIFTTLKPLMYKNNENNRTGITKNTSFNLGDLLSSAGQTGVFNWQGVGGTNNSRAKIDFSNSIGVSTSDFPYQMSLFSDIQTYYIRDNATKNSYYGRVATDSLGNPVYTDRQIAYNANRVPILLSSHGITYQAGTKTRSTIEIIDPSGVVWVKCEQRTGVTNTQNNGDYSNNHKEMRDIATISEDCRFWLLNAVSYYDVKITVYDAACRFDVYHPDNTATDNIPYNEGSFPTVSAGSTYTFRILNAKMQQPNINQRVIKINNNRWPSTT